MAYKLVAIDVDGTLLNNNKEIPAENKEMMERLADEGVNFILASGRPYQSLKPYTEELEVYLPLISANGSMVKCCLTDRVYHKSNLPLAKAQEIVDYGLDNGYGISVYYEGKILTSHQEMVKGHVELEGIRPEVEEELRLSKPPIKIIYYGSEEKIDHAYSFLGEKYQHQLYITRSDEEYLEVMNIEVSKGEALEYMMDKMNLEAEEVIAIGNNFNDVAMFETAGLAVAVENAPQEVKEQADFVAKSNQDNGVAHALQKIIVEDGAER
ncbi:MAG: Cof-type HAD-IIB family hydrolase [Halanaerobacter sp.]